MRLEKGYFQNDFSDFNFFCCIFADAMLSTTESWYDLVFHAIDADKRVKSQSIFYCLGSTSGRCHVAAFGFRLRFML